MVFPTSFSDCFSQQKLERFWESPYYLATNPYIYDFQVMRFYSFAFDNSTQGLILDEISLADAQQLLSGVPADARRDFSLAASSLDSASSSLAAARESQRSAHLLSAGAQRAASELLDSATILLLQMPSPISSIGALSAFLKVNPVIQYIGLYSMQFSKTLSQAADSYDSVNAAASEMAKMADEQFEYLNNAGAGESHFACGNGRDGSEGSRMEEQRRDGPWVPVCARTF